MKFKNTKKMQTYLNYTTDLIITDKHKILILSNPHIVIIASKKLKNQ